MISALWLYPAVCFGAAVGFFACAALTVGKQADVTIDLSDATSSERKRFIQTVADAIPPGAKVKA